MVMFKLKLLKGVHLAPDRKEYQPGEVLYCNYDLSKMFINKFELLNGEENPTPPLDNEPLTITATVPPPPQVVLDEEEEDEEEGESETSQPEGVASASPVSPTPDGVKKKKKKKPKV